MHVEELGADRVERAVTLSVRSKRAMRAVNEWCVSSGELFVTDEPDFYFRAYQHAEIEWEEISRTYYSASVVFDLIPYWYLQSGRTPIQLTQASQIFNSTPTESEPLFELEASGTVTLYVNNQIITAVALESGLTIDSEMQMAWHQATSMTHAMKGDYPILLPGKNRIDWIGDVRKLTITPRWRML